MSVAAGPLIAALLMAQSAQAQMPSGGNDQVCSAAAAVLAFDLKHQRLGRKMVIVDEDYKNEVLDSLSATDALEFMQQLQTAENAGWRSTPPSAETIAAFRRAPASSAAAVCANVRALAAEHQVRIISADQTVPFHPLRRTGLFPADLIDMGVPVIGPSGSEALVAHAVGSGSLAGTGAILLLRRSAEGAWRVVDAMPVSVS